MSDFKVVAKLSDIPDPGKLCVELDERFIVIVHRDGKIFCLDDVCTHDGGPLGEGELDGNCLVCPRHGARFDIESGAAVTMPATEATAVHSVRIEDGEILVQLTDD